MNELLIRSLAELRAAPVLILAALDGHVAALVCSMPVSPFSWRP